MRVTDILDSPGIYRLWQAPFVRQKLAPVVQSGVLGKANSVLDVGCGPGTNAATFRSVHRYVGVDLNERYIRFAEKRYRGEFLVGDVTEGMDAGEQFDLVLMNSLMHHLDDEGAGALLDSLKAVTASEGEIHVLDLVLAPSGIPRRMALADRGEHPRNPSQWVDLVQPWLTVQHTSQYSLGVGPLELWRMIHMTLTVPEARPHQG